MSTSSRLPVLRSTSTPIVGSSTLLHSRLRGHPAVPGVDPALRGQRGPRPAHRGRAAARRAEDPRRWRTSGLFPSRTTGPAFAFARYFTGENRDFVMALDQARGVVLERLRRSRSPARERVRQCSRRLGLEVRQNVPLGSRRHPSWGFPTRWAPGSGRPPARSSPAARSRGWSRGNRSPAPDHPICVTPAHPGTRKPFRTLN